MNETKQQQQYKNELVDKLIYQTANKLQIN